MEGTLRIGLLIVVAVIVFLMMFESRSRRRRTRSTDEPLKEPQLTQDHFLDEALSLEPSPELVPEIKTASKQEKTSNAPDYLVISVVARAGHHFASYDLLQAISAVDMQFGDMNIFHYYHDKQKLFSLASVTEPGDFDMDRIGDFSCAGLTLFMDMNSVPDVELAFELMLSTAQQLADDLEGELRAGQKQPWSQDILKQFRNKVSTFTHKEFA